jgi:hypothetical protein
MSVKITELETTYKKNENQEVLQKTNPPAFISLWRKLNITVRYDRAQNYRIGHSVVQRLFKYNVKIYHHCNF